jgi:hypothetical protein
MSVGPLAPIANPAFIGMASAMPRTTGGITGNGEIDALLGMSNSITGELQTQGAILEQQQAQAEAMATLQTQQAYQRALQQQHQKQLLDAHQQQLLQMQQLSQPQFVIPPTLHENPQASYSQYSNLLRQTLQIPQIPPHLLNGMRGQSPPVHTPNDGHDHSTSGTSGTEKNGDANPTLQGEKNPDGSIKLVDVGNGRKLNTEAAKAYNAANAEFKAKYGYDIPIISAYRSKEHNRRIGGAAGSKHTMGGAIDLDQNTLERKGHWDAATYFMRKHGLEPLEGVIYNKPGSGPQDEANHFEVKGVGKTNLHLSKPPA